MKVLKHILRYVKRFKIHSGMLQKHALTEINSISGVEVLIRGA